MPTGHMFTKPEAPQSDLEEQHAGVGVPYKQAAPAQARPHLPLEPVVKHGLQLPMNLG